MNEISPEEDDMEKGYVKCFYGRDNQRFGFIIPDNGGGEIFFHYNAFRKFEPGEHGQPVFSNTGYGHPAAFPRKDQQVWFVRGTGAKGPVAQSWGYCDDYFRVMQEMQSCLSYGENFIYMPAPGIVDRMLPELLGQCGEVRSLKAFGNIRYKYAYGPNRDQAYNPDWMDLMSEEDRAEYEAGEARLEKYRQILYRNDYVWPDNVLEVIPKPGMEKLLGRLFRRYSVEDGRDMRRLVIVEIPKQYEYKGIMEHEFLRKARSLSHAEVVEKIHNGKPVFTRSAYWNTWYRLVGFMTDENSEQMPLQVSLTPTPNTYGASTWEKDVAAISLHMGWLGGTSRNDDEGPYTLLPDTVKDDMIVALGAELANRLLTEDFTKLFTSKQISIAQRNTKGNSWVTLDEVLSVTA